MKAGAIAALAIAGALGACAEDYMDRRDSISSTFGNATEQNMATQIIDPWPAHARDTRITMDGSKAAQAVRNYKCRQPDPLGNGNGGAVAAAKGFGSSATAINVTNQAPPPAPGADC